MITPKICPPALIWILFDLFSQGSFGNILARVGFLVAPASTTITEHMKPTKSADGRVSSGRYLTLTQGDQGLR